jgi:hypothetical protein
MPRRREHAPTLRSIFHRLLAGGTLSTSARPIPIQLPLFAETAAAPDGTLSQLSPGLFGRALLVRQWGRIGTEGRRRLDPHPDPGAAINALADILRAKRRRGYQDRTA